MVSTIDRAVDQRQRGGSTTARWLVVLVAVAVIVTAAYAVVGTNFVLDDWFTLANAHFDGALGAAGSAQQVARPVRGSSTRSCSGGSAGIRCPSCCCRV